MSDCDSRGNFQGNLFLFFFFFTSIDGDSKYVTNNLCSSAHRMIDITEWATILMSVHKQCWILSLLFFELIKNKLLFKFGNCDSQVKPQLVYDISLCNRINLVFTFNNWPMAWHRCFVSVSMSVSVSVNTVSSGICGCQSHF